MKKNGFTVVELITSFTLASVIMIILFNIVLILKDNLSNVNAKTNMLIEKDNLSYNINKRFKEKELSSVTMCDEGDKCYEFTYSDNTSDKLIYSNTDKTITFNNYTFDIVDGITVEEPVITEHYDTMSSTAYNGYFIIHIPIKLDDKDYSIKVVKHFNTDSLVMDLPKYEYDNEGNKYTVVEYLEATGEQYIDTLLVSSSSSHIYYDIDFEVEKTGTTTEDRMPIGGPNFAFNTYFLQVYNNKFYMFNINSNTNCTELHNRVKFYLEKWYINDSLINMQITYPSRDINIYLFRWGDKYSKNKLYKCTFYDKNGLLIRDYIPVIDSTETPCMFDKVEKKCYYNQGTGEFLWG